MLQWPVPLCLYQLDRSVPGSARPVSQGVPILMAAGKIRACLMRHLHVGQTLCDRSLLIACVEPVLGSEYAQILNVCWLDDSYNYACFL